MADDPPSWASCAICMDVISSAAIASCAHHFCHACLLEWCASPSPACPKCRMPIHELRLDPEFDEAIAQVLGVAPAAASAASAPLTIDLELPRGSKAGITLANSDDGGPGCKVSRVNPLDMAYRCGLRVGDVIVALNGVPTTSHDQAIALINAATLASRPVRCALRPLARPRHAPLAPPAAGAAAATTTSAAGLSEAGPLRSETTDDAVTYFIKPLASAGGSRWELRARYSRWRELWQALAAERPSDEAVLPAFPPKALHAPSVGIKQSALFVERRRAALDTFAGALLTRSAVQPDLASWLRPWVDAPPEAPPRAAEAEDAAAPVAAPMAADEEWCSII